MPRSATRIAPPRSIGRAGRPIRDQHGRVHLRRQGQSLRSRLTSPDVASLAPPGPAAGDHHGQVEWTVVGTEVEALQLGYTWIRSSIRDSTSATATTSPTLCWRSPWARISPVDDRGPRRKRCALARAVLARVGNPGNAGSAHPGVSGANAQRGCLSGTGRSIVMPARLHRQMFRAVCGRSMRPSTARS